MPGAGCICQLFAFTCLKKRPWKPFLHLFPGWQKAAFCSTIRWKVKCVNMSGQHRTAVLPPGLCLQFFKLCFCTTHSRFLTPEFHREWVSATGDPSSMESSRTFAERCEIHVCKPLRDVLWLYLATALLIQLLAPSPFTVFTESLSSVCTFLHYMELRSCS